MIVVSDSSPLIALTFLGRLDILQALYEQVIVPDAVWHETVIAGENRPGQVEILSADWIQRFSLRERSFAEMLSTKLDAGEAEAIALALELNAEYLLIDDRQGRKAANNLGLRVVGVVGVLLAAKAKGLVSTIRPELIRLRTEAGFRVSDSLLQKALAMADEIDIL